MKDLIEALTIFSKYTDTKHPTYCGYDALYICSVDPESVSDEDKSRLDELGFFESDEGGFMSYRFGSC